MTEKSNKISKYEFIAMLLILVLMGLQRVWIFNISPAVANDSIYILRMAKQMDVSWDESIKTGFLHPGYPAMVDFTHRVFYPGDNSVAGWENTGFAVAMLMSLVGLLGVWCFARMLFRNNQYAGAIALISMLLAGVGRKLMILGSDVLSDSVAAAFAIWAAVAAVICVNTVLEKKKIIACLWAAATGILCGLSYMVRFETLAAIAVILFIMFAWPVLKRRGITTAIFCVVIACIFIFLSTLPYTSTIGTFSNKYTLKLYEAAACITGNGSLLATATPYPVDTNPAVKFISKFFEIIHPANGVMLVIYFISAILAKSGNKFRRVRESLPWPNALPACLAGGIFVAFAGITMLHYSKSGAFAARYLTIPVMLLIPFAAAEIIGIMTFLAKGGNQKAGKIVAWIFILGLTLGMGLHAGRPWHEDHVNMKQAGEFIRNNIKEAPILTESLVIEHYANIPNVTVFNDIYIAHITKNPDATTEGYNYDSALLKEIEKKSPAYQWMVLTYNPDENIDPRILDTLKENGFISERKFSQQKHADIAELYRRSR